MEATYPHIFSGRYGGFCIDEGWWPIVDALCAEIQRHINRNNVKQVVALQVKEKFGGLRFYYSGGDAVIDGMVQMAESWAVRTCEKCGSPGEPRDTSWIKTLCENHYKENDKNKISV